MINREQHSVHLGSFGAPGLCCTGRNVLEADLHQVRFLLRGAVRSAKEEQLKREPGGDRVRFGISLDMDEPLGRKHPELPPVDGSEVHDHLGVGVHH